MLILYQTMTENLPRVPPSNLDYSRLLPLGVKAVSKARKFQPNNGSAFSSSNNIIRIPLNSTGFLDPQHSYLAFTVTVKNNEASKYVSFDGSAHSVIRTLRLIGSDGAELEYIQHYNVVRQAMADLQVGSNHSATLGNAMEGEATTAGDDTTTKIGTADGSGNNFSRGYSIKIMSALLNNSKYLPLGFIAGGGLILELTLENDATCLIKDSTAAGGTAPTYELSEIHYVGQIVEMDERFNASFRSMLNSSGGIQFSGQTWRTHQYNFTSAASGNAVVPVAERSKSMKSLFHIFREQANLADRTKYSIMRRSSNDVEQVQWKIGSNVYPSQPLKGSQTDSSQYVAELVKAVAGLGDIRQGSAINQANFPVVANTSFGSAMYALDFESYAQASDILESGIDTSSLALPINVEFTFGSTAVAGTLNVLSCALVDAIYTLDSQGMLTVSI